MAAEARTRQVHHTQEAASEDLHNTKKSQHSTEKRRETELNPLLRDLAPSPCEFCVLTELHTSTSTSIPRSFSGKLCIRECAFWQEQNFPITILDITGKTYSLEKDPGAGLLSKRQLCKEPYLPKALICCKGDIISTASSFTIWQATQQLSAQLWLRLLSEHRNISRA